MKNLVRYISDDGTAVAFAINSTDIVSKAEKTHNTSAVVTAALGRTLTAASLMGIELKNKDDSITVRFKGDGPIGSIVAVSDSYGNVKGYAMQNIVELPLNSVGKLDVGTAVGKGTLTVIKDIGLKEPYVGQIPIVSGEIAEDITSYYATSQQTPTVCGLGVLVNPDLSVNCAGGFLVQLLPFAEDSTIEQIEKNINGLPSVTQMIGEGKTVDDICKILLGGLNPHVLDEFQCDYKCDCSKGRTEKALISIGKNELSQIIEEDGKAEIVCHFCNSKYDFNKEELKSLLKEI